MRGQGPLYVVYPAAALEGPLYRIVRPCPPTEDHFRSYEALGRPYDRRRFFRGTGVSMYLERDRAVEVRRRFGHGEAIAALDLRSGDAVWARTGGRAHVTVWAAPNTLLACVVECENDGI